MFKWAHKILCSLDMHDNELYLIGGKLYKRCKHCRIIHHLTSVKCNGILLDEWRETWTFTDGLVKMHGLMDAIDRENNR